MELAQLLQLIAGWLDSDPALLSPSLLDHIGARLPICGAQSAPSW
jgi:hypothetical protein